MYRINNCPKLRFVLSIDKDLLFVAFISMISFCPISKQTIEGEMKNSGPRWNRSLHAQLIKPFADAQPSGPVGCHIGLCLCA